LKCKFRMKKVLFVKLAAFLCWKCFLLFSPRSLNNLVLPNALETLKTQNNNENIISWSSKYTEREVGLVGVNGVKVHPIMEIFCRLVNRTQTKGTPSGFFQNLKTQPNNFKKIKFSFFGCLTCVPLLCKNLPV
jgi:hypothetical protein